MTEKEILFRELRAIIQADLTFRMVQAGRELTAAELRDAAIASCRTLDRPPEFEIALDPQDPNRITVIRRA